MNEKFTELPELKVLSLEDSLLDFEIIKEKLLSVGYKLNITHVERESEFITLIRANVFDIILADFNLPGFDGFEALKLCIENCPDTPFICVSGSIGEIKAIELLKYGAIDYVLKDRLERLQFAVKRALEEANEKRERQLAGKALKESEECLRDIIFSSADWVWEVDENGKYTYTSQRGLELFEVSYEDIIGKTPFDFMPEDEANRVAKIFAKIVADKAPIKDLENWNISKNGNKICLLTNGVPIQDKDGQLKGYRGVDKNITERKQAELELIKAKEKAEASDRLKTAFMNNISHEIRTPLNGIVGFGQILIDEDLLPEERIRALSMLNKSSDRLINTVTNFMDISLLNSGNQEVYKKKIDLHTLTNKAIGKFDEAVQKKNLIISIDSTSAENDVIIFTDDDLLSKIIHQIIDNAVKFTYTGSITIGYKLNNTEVNIIVKDTGVGISEEIKNQIFGSFTQENILNTRGYEGSGIGLSIAKGFAELLGGNICLHSEKGKGSTFYLSIPCKDDVIENKPATPILQSLKKNIHHTILVAEDDEINFIYLEILLTHSSRSILHSVNGFQTVEICRNHPEICLVLMDLKMPEMDGFEATRQIKQFRPDLPVLALTAYAGSEDKKKAMHSGCDDYLTKPVKNEFLLKKMEEFCKIAL